MAVTIPTNFALEPAVSLRVGEPISGRLAGEIPDLLDNGTYLYAKARPTIIDAGGLADEDDWQTSSSTPMEVINAWVELEEDATALYWNAYGDDVDITVAVYDDIARTSTLDGPTTTTITGTTSQTDVRVPTAGSLGHTAGVLVVVSIDHRGGGAALPARLINFRMYQAALIAADLPT